MDELEQAANKREQARINLQLAKKHYEEADRAYTKVQSKTVRNIPDYGDHMPIEEFKECVESGGFIDDDGHGYLATATFMSREYADLYNLDEVDPMYTHVVWFNK